MALNRPSTALSLALVLAAVPLALAEEEDWLSLFDGKSLAGWEASENPESWSVVEGSIRAHGERSHLFYTGREFKDFVLRVDVKTEPGSNAGIYFHTANHGPGWPEVGHECQVNVSHRDPVKTGSIYGVVKLYETPAKDDEWWTQEISVRGQNIVVRINGKVVADYTEPEGIRGTRKLSKGLIALQAHDPRSVVYFKNLRIQPLD